MEADTMIGPAEMRRLARLHGGRLLLTGNPGLWMLAVTEYGWSLPRCRYRYGEFLKLLTLLAEGRGWELGDRATRPGRGYLGRTESDWSDPRQVFHGPYDGQPERWNMYREPL